MGQNLKRQKTTDDSSYTNKSKRQPKSNKLGSSKVDESETDMEPVQSQLDGEGKEDEEESEGRK